MKRWIFVFGGILFLTGFQGGQAGPVPNSTGYPSGYPKWWFERDVIERLNSSVSSPVYPTDYPVADDYAVLNQGQLKNLGTKAYAEMVAKLPAAVWSTTAGTALTAAVVWPTATDDYAVINQGQMKNLASKFYDVLKEAHYVSQTTPYPWTGATTDDDDYAVVNLGQAKQLFSFDLTAASGELPAWWKEYYFGPSVGITPGGDTDGDGASNLQEYEAQTDPNDYYNGVTPTLEIVSGNLQTGDLGSYSEPLVVRVKMGGVNAYNAPVKLTVTSGGGKLTTVNSSGAIELDEINLKTDLNGLATVYSGTTVNTYYLQPDDRNAASQITATAGTALPIVFTLNTLNYYLVGRWAFNEGSGTTAVDQAGGGHNGTLTGGAGWSTGVEGSGALHLDGVNDCVTVGTATDTSLGFGTDSFSVSLWAKYTTIGKNPFSRRLVSKGHHGWNTGYFVGVSPTGGIEAGIGTTVSGTPSEAALIGTTATFNDGLWHHIAVTFDRELNRIKIYVDQNLQTVVIQESSGGTVVGTNALDISGLTHLNATQTNQVLSFAAHVDAGGYDFFAGDMDDIRLYQGVLDAAKIDALSQYTDDSDGDGMSDGWENEHFGSTANGDPSQDSDGDGLSNLEEFKQGSDPNDYYSQGGVTITPYIKAIKPRTTPPYPLGNFNEILADPLIVEVHNGGEFGPVLINAPVTYTPGSTGGWMTLVGSGAPQLFSPLNLRTNSSGRAQAFFEMPGTPGSPITVAVTAGTALPVTFNFDFDSDSLAPAAPTDAHGYRIQSRTIALYWKDQSNNETEFVVEKNAGSGWEPLATLPANTSSYQHTGFTYQANYSYRIKAVNANGPSSWTECEVDLASGSSAVDDPNGDWDGDKLTNAYEADIGTRYIDPDSDKDTDGDGVNDNLDGWAREGSIEDHERLPEVKYAVIEIPTTSATDFASAMNNKAVLVSKKLYRWVDGEWFGPVSLSPATNADGEAILYNSPRSINDDNHFVGNGYRPPASSDIHAGSGVGFYDGTFLGVNDYSGGSNGLGIASYDYYTMTTAAQINDAGFIAGSAVNVPDYGAALPAYRSATGRWTFINLPNLDEEVYFSGYYNVNGELFGINNSMSCFGHIINNDHYSYGPDSESIPPYEYYFFYDGVVTKFPEGKYPMVLTDNDEIILAYSESWLVNDRHLDLWKNEGMDGTIVSLDESIGTGFSVYSANKKLQMVGVIGTDGAIVHNGKATLLNTLVPAGWQIYPSSINDRGLILATGIKDESNKSVILFPIELQSGGGGVEGSFERPDYWENFQISFSDGAGGENVGPSGNLGGTASVSSANGITISEEIESSGRRVIHFHASFNFNGQVQMKVRVGTPGHSAEGFVYSSVETGPNYNDMPVDEAAGPKYRKIALNGRPMPDEKPQQAGETDEEPEETYIDALSMNLRHSTTDIYVPVPASELNLSVRRNLGEAIWTTKSGLRPEEQPVQPFGAGWSSNLGAHIEFTDMGDNSSGPDTATVVDENGISYPFVMWFVTGGVKKFFPMPTGRHEQSTFLTELHDNEDGTFTFKRRFGNELTYQKTTTTRILPANRWEQSDSYDSYTYARLSSVKDRYDNKLVCEYTSGNTDELIPNKISVLGRPSLALTIEKDSFGRVLSVADPLGKKWAYHYGLENSADAALRYVVLTAATGPDKAQSKYTYQYLLEADAKAPKNHVALKTITDPLDHTYTFSYEFDKSKFDRQNGVHVQKTGLPLTVKKVELPTEGDYGSVHADFANHSVLKLETVEGHDQLTEDSVRTTSVTDAMGNERTYTWPKDVAVVESLDAFRALYGLPSTGPHTDPKIVFFPTMEIDHGSGRKETFQFDIDAGMALKSIKDLSNNTTSFTHTNEWTGPAADFYTSIRTEDPPHVFNHYYDDPTSQTNAKGDTKYFEYSDHYRVMSKITNEKNLVTEYTVDTKGRRTKEISKNISNVPVQETDFDYDTTFPDFMVKKTVKDLSGSNHLISLYQHDSNGRVVREAVDLNRNGSIDEATDLITSYTYDANGNKLTVRDPNGNFTRFGYDQRNRLTSVTYPDNTSKTLVYDARGNKIREIDENGYATLFQYDKLNRVARQARDMDGNLEIDDETDLISGFGYNKVNSKTSQTDPKGQTTTFAYDDLQRLTSTTTPAVAEAPSGYTTTFEYNLAKNAGSSAFDSLGFKPTKTTDPRGYVSEITYDELYRPIATKVQYQLSPAAYAETATEYDKVGNATASVDPLGKRTETDYDALNRPTVTRFAVTTPGSANSTYGTQQSFYTSTGLKWKTIDEEGRIAQMEYDGAGRPVKSISPQVNDGYGSTASAETVTAYDKNGNVVATTNPLGKVWNFTYDLRNRKIKEEQPAVVDASSSSSTPVRPTIRTEYDNLGNARRVTDARGNSAYSYYDAANRPFLSLAPSVFDPVSETLKHPQSVSVYDLNGNVTSVTDPNDHVTTNVYDALNRLISSTQDLGASPHLNITVSNEYDSAGNRTKVTDGKGQVSWFEYDGLNRNTRIRYCQAGAPSTPSSTSTVFVYNAMNKESRTDEMGQVTNYAYDARHRLTGVDYVSSNSNVRDRIYAYDRVGNLCAVTEPDPATGGRTNIAYAYDALNRQVKENQGSTHGTTLVPVQDALPTGVSGGTTHTYTYDLAGNRLSTVYGGTGRTIVSTYDALNRLATMTESGLAVSSYGYDLNGNVAKLILPNGDVTRKSYDALNRVSVIETKTGGTTLLSTYTQTYDLGGNVRKIEEDYASSGLTDRTVVNGYDSINRLVSEAITTGSTTVTTVYKFDKANNREKKTVGSTVTDYSYNNLNQLTSVTGGFAAAYTYDNNGNRHTQVIGGITDIYFYDHENRLIGLEKSTPGNEGYYGYIYDYRTRRVVTDEEPQTGSVYVKNVIFSGGTSVQEYSLIDSSLQVEYIRGSDYGGGVGGILYTLRSGTPSYTHYNNRGDVVAKTSSAGALTYEAAYEAYGKRTAEQGSTDDRQKANTKDEDPTGLLNEGFRYRDLETGTFITRDPLGFVDGPNMYAYVVQNPWSKFDPKGLKTKSDYREEIKQYRIEKSAAIQEAKDKKMGSRAEFGIGQRFDAKIKAAENAMRNLDDTAKNINERAKAEVVNAETLDDEKDDIYHIEKAIERNDFAKSIAWEAFYTGVGMATGELAIRWAGLAIKALRAGKGAAGSINLMEKSDQFLINAAKRSDVDVNGVLDVVAHGNAEMVEINGQLMNHRVLAQMISKNPEFIGQDVRLLSCNTGELPTGLAQNLANKLGVNVTAPSDTLWAFPNGRFTIGATPNANTGSWLNFIPGGP